MQNQIDETAATLSDIPNIIDSLQRQFDASVACLRTDMRAFLENGRLPNPTHRTDRRYCYPELVVTYAGKDRKVRHNLAFGRIEYPGTFASTVTQPALYRDYLEDQLGLLIQQYEVVIAVHPSKQEIPFPYVLDGLDMGDVLLVHFQNQPPTCAGRGHWAKWR